MKLKQLSSSCSLACLVTSISSFAAETPVPAPARNSLIVTPTAQVNSRFTLLDNASDRDAYFGGEAASAAFRLGVKAKYGIGFGVVELRYGGNGSRFVNQDNVVKNAGPANNGPMKVGLAHAGLEFESGTTVALGRMNLDEPQAYLADSTDNGFDGPGTIDGLAITQNFGTEQEPVKAQFFLSNVLDTFTLTEAGASDETQFSKPGKTKSLAYGLVLNAKTDIVDAGGYFARKDKHVVEYNETGLAATPASPTARVGDVTMAGATAGVKVAGVRIGAGYEYKQMKNLKTGVIRNNGSFVSANAQATAKEGELISQRALAGVLVRSADFGFGDFFVADDSLVGALSYTNWSRSLDGKQLPNYHEIAAHFGYEDGHLQAFLGASYKMQGRKTSVVSKSETVPESSYTLIKGGQDGDKILKDNTTVFVKLGYHI